MGINGVNCLMIIDECISCGICANECPVGAIYEGSNKYVINNVICTNCEGEYDMFACVVVCPVNAILPCETPGYEDWKY